MASKSLEQAAAFWALGLLRSEEYAQVATEALLQGIDSPSLRQLAGEIRPIASELGPLFERTLRELGISLPDRRGARALVAQYYCHQIIDGEMSPCEGAERIWWDVANDAYDTPDWDRYSAFVGLASSCRDEPQHRSDYERDIIAAAQQLLQETDAT